MQIILGQLDKMKQRYLAYRRHQGDTTDVFARKKTVEKALVGPSPFAELSNLNVLALAQIQSQQQAQQQPQAATQANNTATATTGGLFGNTSANTGGGLFGNTSSNATGGLFGNARFVQDSCFTVKTKLSVLANRQLVAVYLATHRQALQVAVCLVIRRVRRNRPVRFHLEIRHRRLRHRYSFSVLTSFGDFIFVLERL